MRKGKQDMIKICFDCEKPFDDLESNADICGECNRILQGTIQESENETELLLCGEK